MVVRGAAYERKKFDHFPTPEAPVHSLLKLVEFAPHILDPCVGTGAILDACGTFDLAKYPVTMGFDINPEHGFPVLDFTKDDLPTDELGEGFDIITNPPYGIGGRLGVHFIRRSLEVVKPWHGKVAMLLPADYDSASTRVDIFRDHPAFAWRIPLLYRVKWFDGPQPCKACDGEGVITTVMGVNELPSETEKCPKCKGKGEIKSSPAENHCWFVWSWKNVGQAGVLYGD